VALRGEPFRLFERQPKALLWGEGIALIVGIGLLDYLTGHEIAFSIFYLLPVTLTAWYGGKTAGLFAGAFAAVAWLVADLLLPPHYSHVATVYWNATTRLGMFLAISYLLAGLRVRKEDLEAAVRERTAALRAEVAEHKETGRALEASESRLRLMIENARDYAIFMLDAGGCVASWNEGAERLTGFAEAEVLERPLGHLCPEEERINDRPGEAIRQARQHGAHEDEGLWVRKDGSRFWATAVLTAVVDEAGRLQGFSAVLHDITERKQLENELLEVGETERRRIGYDLHDVLGQELTGIAFLGKELEDALAGRGLPEEAEAARIVKQVSQSIDRTRSLARGLAPVELNAEGLMTALAEFTHHMAETFHVECVFRCIEPVLVQDEAVALHLYRIAQEAVSNAIRHGRPKRVVLDLRVADRHTVLTVSDDGSGIPKQAAPSSGMGLRVMHYRAKSIGGVLQVKRGLPRGTVMTCAVPRETGREGKGYDTSRQAV